MRWMILILAVCQGVSAAEILPEQLEFFEEKIRPVLVERCYKCHSKDAEKLKGGLLLDSREGWQTTGDSGPSIVPGDPEESLLITSIRYTDPDYEMPPKEPLAPGVVADFEKWVAMGAPDPRDAPSGGTAVRNVLYKQEDAQRHWAFQPVARIEPPATDDPWIKSPVDAFLLDKMREVKIEPSPPAEHRLILRRAFYDLAGLPPSAEEIADFESKWKSDPDAAFSAVVDRLLASKQYGVKYGRHWLDLARYADTNGNRVAPSGPSSYYPHAWTYRDWVIDTINADVPYDQFVMRQLAGDRLGEPAGLGFVRVGKTFGGNLDDRIDDRIDAVTKTFLGLTVSCARCHDHKFDPVYHTDYYALHGIFSSSEDHDVEIEPASNEFLAMGKTLVEEARISARDAINGYISDYLQQSADYLVAAQAFRDGELKEKKDPDRASREVELHAIPFGAWVGALELWEEIDNPVFAPWFAYAAADESEFSAVTKRIQSGEIETNPLLAEKFGTPPKNLREVAERYQQVALETEAAAAGRYPLTEVIVNLLNVQRRWIGEEYDPFWNAPRELDDPDREELRRVLMGFDGPWGGPRMPPQMLMRSGAGDFKKRITIAMHEVERLAGERSDGPVMAMSMRDLKEPVDSPLYVRGNAKSPGDIVPRAFLTHFAGPKTEPYRDGSGRLEFAKDIVDPNNPLTARVIVNRVWQWHFGKGLVNTPSDFGLNGTPPTHPELLDWLANWFVGEGGWSLKKLHGLLMTSAVYQQSALPRPELADRDPGNTLLWRFPPRRLTYEELRDTILSANNTLDLHTLGGRPVEPGTEPRRTCFLYVDRLELPYEFGIFDFANPDFSTAERDSAIVPQQALFFLNSPWMMKQADLLAGNSTGPDPERLGAIYRALFQRSPTKAEVDLASAYLKQPESSWARLAHALMTGNELVFLY